MSRGRSFNDDDVKVLTEAIDEKIDRVTKGDGETSDPASQRMTLAGLFRTREKIAPSVAAQQNSKPAASRGSSRKGASSES